MADHQELVTEMTLLEKMSTQDRLKLARKRRVQQLKKWNQREKEFASKRKKNDPSNSHRKGPSGHRSKYDYKVHFVPSVMLLEAAARNDIDEVRRLLMLSVSPDSTNEDGLTALHQCCIDDSEDMMKLLVEFGANVNAKDSEQWTPLHAAATCGHLHLVRYLIAKGADLLAVNADGNMPYDICEDEPTLDYIENEMAKRGITQEMIDETRASTENQMLKDLKKLASANEDLEVRDKLGATPLHIASANGYVLVVEFLLDNHVSTDVVDNDLWQPVHAAACWGHPDVLEMLVQAGADLDAKTKNGETPLDICEDPELKERIIQLKNEQEIKKSSQNNSRLKRSHSSNTRTQSVRRTSIREKSQISRREAKLEAKMRQSSSISDATSNVDTDEDDRVPALSNNVVPDILQNTSQALSKSTPISSNVSRNGMEVKSGSPKDEVSSLQPIKVSSRKQPVNYSESNDVVCLTPGGQVNGGSKPRPEASKKNVNDSHVITRTRGSESDPAPCPDDANANQLLSHRKSSNDSVKVEIHVTVNTNQPSVSLGSSTGTLADLKKIRSDQRRSNDSNGTSVQDISLKKSCGSDDADGPATGSNNNSTVVRTFHSVLSPPPSPSRPNIFRGDPSEVVGGDYQKQGCCSIS